MLTTTKKKEPDRKPDRKRRFSPVLWLASLGSIGVLALGINGTLGQFVANITNTNNHVETGGPDSFGFSESNVIGGVPEDPACAEASAGQSVNCADINKNGALGADATPMAPGQSRSTTVRLQNTAVPIGLSGALTLLPATCTQTPVADPIGPPVVGDLCGTATVAVHCSGSPGTTFPAFDVGPVTLSAFASGAPAGGYVIGTPVDPAAFVDCTFTTSLAATATNPNLQGILTSQPMTWTFTQV